MKKHKLNVDDFYHQFHGHEHHNDPGDYVKPEWHEIKNGGKHKPLNLKALRNSKRKKAK